MSAQWKKRFWKEALVEQTSEGFIVKLDDRPLKTPARSSLTVPSFGLAEAIAKEWQSLENEIDPGQLPFTKLCNAAIDNMSEKSPAVVDTLAAYAETDLLCYRAQSPDGLVSRQNVAWNPLLDWLRDVHGILLTQTSGVIPVEQPPSARAQFADWLGTMNNFELMGAHDLVMISGSIVLARAVIEKQIDPSVAWDHSIIDEAWQIEQWGDDEEASIARSQKARDFSTAAKLMELLHA